MKLSNPPREVGESPSWNVVRTGCANFTQNVSRAITNPLTYPTSGQEDE